ncbi:MAG: hypothetical protein IJD22_04310 [Clostridia bacterium]|nr:hypothetical protein [Clostridia bacterium]
MKREKKEKKQKQKKIKDFRRVKTVPAMQAITPFIMTNRVGAMNLMTDRFNVTGLDKYLKQKRAEGLTGITAMHVIIAAYIRLVSQRPALNRFIRGQRIWTRRSIEISLTIKKEMTLESPDTVVKVIFEPDATVEDVYKKMTAVINEYRNDPGGDFDNTAGFLSKAPTLLLKFTIAMLRTMDFFGLLPKFLEKVSPFHCSMFITSMGSLGIPPIYHHLYDFGTCPVFLSFGAKKREYKLNPDGSLYKEQYIDMSFALDERICDGFYYASALKMMKHLIRNPEELDNPPARIFEDIE